jgi:hypothetical protein
MGMLYEYDAVELEAMGFTKEAVRQRRETLRRELQSRVDQARCNNIVRATETFEQTMARIKAMV